MTFLLCGELMSGIPRVGHGERRLKTRLGRFDAETGASITDWLANTRRKRRENVAKTRVSGVHLALSAKPTLPS